MDRTLKCDHSLNAIEQYFTVVINFGLGTVRSGRVLCEMFLKTQNEEWSDEFRSSSANIPEYSPGCQGCC